MRVEGRQLSMEVTGDNLDGNYTLAVNPGEAKPAAPP